MMIDKMLESVNKLKKTDKILDYSRYCGQICIALIKKYGDAIDRNNLYALVDNKISKCLTKKTFALYGIPQENILYVDESKPNKIKEALKDMSKFDYIIGNPPYDGNLHLKILDAVKDYGEKVIWLHPGGWLYSEKQVNFIKHFKVLDYFSQIEFRKLFNAESQNGAIISMYDKDIIEPEYNELYCKYGQKDFVPKLHELKTQIFAKMKTADNWNNRLQFMSPDELEHGIICSIILGGSGGRSAKLNSHYVVNCIIDNGIIKTFAWPGKNDKYVGKKYTEKLKDRSENNRSYDKNRTGALCIDVDIDTAYKMMNYAKTSYSFKLLDVLFRYDQNPKFNVYPWLNDWTDDECYKLLGISKEDQQWFENLIDTNKII